MSSNNASATISASDIAYIRKGMRAAGQDDRWMDDDTIRHVATLRLMAIEAESTGRGAAAVKKAEVTDRVRLTKGDAPTGGASAGPSAPRAARVTTQRSFGDTLRDSLHRTDGTRPSATAQQIADRLRDWAQRSSGGSRSYSDTVRSLLNTGGVASQARAQSTGLPDGARMTPPSIISQGTQQGDGLLPPASRQSTTWLPRPGR